MGRGSKLTFLQRGHAEANRRMKRCSMSLFREMQVKPQWVSFQACQNGRHQSIHKRVWVRMWRKGNSRALLVVLQIRAATVENSIWSFFKTLKIELLYYPESLPQYLSEEIQNTSSKDRCSLQHYLQYQDSEAAQVPVN